LKDKNMYDLLQSRIDGWDQKSDMEKDGHCTALLFWPYRLVLVPYFRAFELRSGAKPRGGGSRAQRGPKAPTQ
jgi:hypothetical protein